MTWRPITPGRAILAAAERLYADRGFGDVTLRDIVAAAGVNLAAVNYHFGSKDELIAELFVTRSLATNRERLNELKAAEEAGGGRAGIDAILRALVGPTLRGCLGPDRERSTAARFMIRASIESVPPIRRIKNREIDHLRKFAAAMRRSLPGRQRGRSLLGPAFRARDGAPDHPRQRAADQTVGRKMRPQRRRRHHRARRRGVGDGADGARGGEEAGDGRARGARDRSAVNSMSSAHAASLQEFKAGRRNKLRSMASSSRISAWPKSAMMPDLGRIDMLNRQAERASSIEPSIGMHRLKTAHMRRSG